MSANKTKRSDPATDDQFYRALLGEDPLGAIVRAHIHIEARVNQVLWALTPHPGYLPANLRYEQRIRMAVALGLNEVILQPLKVLGDMRNNFAHRLDVTLTEAMVDGLWLSFSKDLQAETIKAFQNTNAKFDVPVVDLKAADARLRFIIMAITIDKYLITAEKEALLHPLLPTDPSSPAHSVIPPQP